MLRKKPRKLRSIARRLKAEWKHFGSCRRLQEFQFHFEEIRCLQAGVLQSAKSYIRQQDPVTKKWTSVIGACCENHAWICKELVKFVEKGYDKKVLYEKRAKLMAPDVD